MISIYLTGLGLIAIISWMVARPFFDMPLDVTEREPAAGDDPWRKQKDEALAGIREAEFDFHLGKLSESDYRDMRRRLETRALEAIRALEGGGDRDHDR